MNGVPKRHCLLNQESSYRKSENVIKRVDGGMLKKMGRRCDKDVGRKERVEGKNMKQAVKREQGADMKFEEGPWHKGATRGDEHGHMSGIVWQVSTYSKLLSRKSSAGQSQTITI